MIMRAEHAADFVSIQNDAVRDDRLSLAARGLLVYMLSMSDGWGFSVSGLAQALKISRPTVIKYIKELQAAGYVSIKKERNTRGQLAGQSWTVYEIPANHSQKNQSTETLTTANHSQKNRTTEKPYYGFFDTKKDQILEVPNSKKDQVLSVKEKHKRKPAGINNNVFLTAEERESLNATLGTDNAGRYIDLLSFYLNDHPEIRYESHFKTILKWFERDHKAKGA